MIDMRAPFRYDHAIVATVGAAVHATGFTLRLGRQLNGINAGVLTNKENSMPRTSILRAAAASAFLISLAAHGEGSFRLTSPDVSPQATIGNTYVFSGFGCKGGNRSPALAWQGAPGGTQSYALTVFDPDVPTGKGWWHWIVVDIPASVSSLATGAGEGSGTKLPAGSRQIRNDFGNAAYGGPCPPAGDKPHRYVFTVYALKMPHLDVPVDATPAVIDSAIHSNAIAETSFTVHYGR
jgi:Raf kinase inhibitor-like YbhB/YbcL family protein